ncbi:hypothetical protein C477_18280 [Haloterrigena salina JCM 13891]|uniref:Uncharacterized protein n=1 Tax=Haloterrigena salina JCM 13891 TaxID=1227488 RepID=M0BYJ6_9EURY|nr:hypothetical protein C477_18280 [Haloterrigena salina JCM 13891]
MGQRGASKEEHTLEVDLEDRVPVVLADLLEPISAVVHPEQADAGVVDQRVDPAELVDRSVDDLFDGVGIADVRGNDERFTDRSAAISVMRSSSRAVRTTRAPSAANRSTIALPRPRLAPVTTMTSSANAGMR